jgi:drug/metabolite transporter (DMT)-like permease
MGEMLAIGALFLFSANIIITKLATDRMNLHVGFLISVGVNVLFALLLFLMQIIFFANQPVYWNWTGFFLFLLTGLFSTFLGRWLFFETIEKLGPTRASTFQITNPLFTTIIAWVFMNEKLGWLDIFNIILIFTGLFLVSHVSNSTGQKEMTFLHTGVLIALLSSLSYAVGNVLRGAAIQTWNEPILGGILGASMGLFLHVVTNKNSKNFWSELRKSDRKGIMFYSISGVLTISAQILVIASMAYIPISIANLITLSTPVLVTPVSYFLFKNKEKITFKTISGIVLVMIGISLIVLK